MTRWPEADFKPHFSTLAIKFVDDILSLGARCITLVRATSSHNCTSNEGTGTSIQSRAFKPRVWRAGSTSRLRYRRRPPCEVRKSTGVTGLQIRLTNRFDVLYRAIINIIALYNCDLRRYDSCC